MIENPGLQKAIVSELDRRIGKENRLRRRHNIQATTPQLLRKRPPRSTAQIAHRAMTNAMLAIGESHIDSEQPEHHKPPCHSWQFGFFEDPFECFPWTVHERNLLR